MVTGNWFPCLFCLCFFPCFLPLPHSILLRILGRSLTSNQRAIHHKDWLRLVKTKYCTEWLNKNSRWNSALVVLVNDCGKRKKKPLQFYWNCSLWLQLFSIRAKRITKKLNVKFLQLFSNNSRLTARTVLPHQPFDLTKLWQYSGIQIHFTEWKFQMQLLNGKKDSIHWALPYEDILSYEASFLSEPSLTQKSTLLKCIHNIFLMIHSAKFG